MVTFNCPFCCNETFDTASSLKCHIMDILGNLGCPSCHKKFEKVESLVGHLGEDCGGTKDGGDDGVQGSLLAKALLEGKDGEADNTEDKDGGEEESQFYCQMCDLHFDDVDEHLSRCHEGQEIILEEEDTESSDFAVEDNTVFIISPDEQLELEEDPPPDTPTKNYSTPSPHSSKKLNTITQQDIKDKNGHLYTRKFVKIDKFWLKHDPIVDPTQKPTVHTFVIDDHQQSDEITREVYNCEVCNTTFPTFKSLRLHSRMHEPIRTREIEAPANYEEGEEPVRNMFICKVCNKTYDKEYEQIHMGSHSENNGYNCDVCNRKFGTQSNLDMHMKAHSNNKKFTCSYCKKPFVSYDAFSDHLLNQCQKRAYACQFCGRRFARPHEKVKHERIHTGEKPHVCGICGKSFRVSYCLTLHLRTHSGTRPYQCKYCPKRFKSHSVYNHHLLTHSDVRAYKCPYCPKSFKTSVQLAGHKNSHIKPFTCTECNRPFASLYAVRAHLETHKRTNNLKYECWMCGALYSRAFALRDHLKQQHQQLEGEKAKAVDVDEEMDAASGILVTENDIILGLGGAVMEGEGENE